MSISFRDETVAPARSATCGATRFCWAAAKRRWNSTWLSCLGKERVRIVCMDLASVCRALVRKHIPNARIVAYRFHFARLMNHHFLACWREIDPVRSKHRGLLSPMRRHRKLEAYFEQFPVLRAIYRFKQRMCYLLLKKHRTRQECVPSVQRFLKVLHALSQAGLPQLVQLGQTLASW